MNIFSFTVFQGVPKINFLKLRLFFYPFFITLIILSFLIFGIKGLNLGIEFVGGGSINFSLNDPCDISKIRKILDKPALKDIILQEVGENHTEFFLRIGSASTKYLGEKISKVKYELDSNFPNINYKEFSIIGPQIGKQVFNAGILSVFISFLVIFFYIWIRFNLLFSFGILLTILNNLILSFGFLSLFNLEINLQIVAAILTIIGYSINDSVVVYDKVRNNLKNKTILGLKENFVLSINQSLTRTLITSITSLASNLVLIFYGGEAIANFAILVFAGIFLGTVFSIFLAAPVIYDLAKIKILKSIL
ncbi:MAG: protein translocase subunit SecF [Rickettsia sp.]|nr:protein translocase subunit SecF [Rickettsia sp.]